MSDPSITTDSASAPEQASRAPDPIKIEPRKADPVEPVKKPSIRDSIAKASKEVEATEAPKPVRSTPQAKDAKVDPKAKAAVDKTTDRDVDKSVDKTADRARGDHGHFASSKQDDEDDSRESDDEVEQRERQEKGKASRGHRAAEVRQRTPEEVDTERTPPKRWNNPIAQEAWDSIAGDEHEAIRHEIHRTLRENEAGIEKHRASAERYSSTFKQFDDMAKDGNVDPTAWINNAVGIDRLLSKPETFVKGVETLLNAKGVTLQQLAQHVLGTPAKDGQEARPGVPGKSAEQVALDKRLGGVETALSQIGQMFQQQKVTQTAQSVESFAAENEHFEVLAERIAQIIGSEGLALPDAYAKALDEAQSTAEALGFSLGAEPKPKTGARREQIADDDERVEQIARGSKSIKGAPNAGAEPARRKPSGSIIESVRKARAKVA